MSRIFPRKNDEIDWFAFWQAAWPEVTGQSPPRRSPRPPQGVLTPKQVAAHFGVAVETVREWIHMGLLPAVELSKKPGSKKPRYGVTADQLALFQQRRQVRPMPPRRPRPR